MKIGLNLLYLIPGDVGGTETYARGLINGLTMVQPSSEFFLFLNREAADWPIPDTGNVHRVVCPVAAVRRWKRYGFEQFRLPRLVRDYGVDVLHSLGYVAPLRCPCPSIVTVHDLNYRAFGDQMPWARRMTLEFFVKHSVRRADRVITESTFSADEILQAFGVPKERVTVIYAAAEPARTAPGATPVCAPFAHGIQPPYIVAFSSRSPNKNIPRLIEAFAQARESRGLAHQLVLVGHGITDAEGAARGCGDGGVWFTGYLPDDASRAVLANADMLAFPSVYEGFGLPILEAMAAGVPVVCSNRGSLPEVAGDAAVLFDPFSTQDMADKLAEVAGNPTLRAALVRRGWENLKRFSWEKTAQQTLEMYRDVLAARELRG